MWIKKFGLTNFDGMIRLSYEYFGSILELADNDDVFAFMKFVVGSKIRIHFIWLLILRLLMETTSRVVATLEVISEVVLI